MFYPEPNYSRQIKPDSSSERERSATRHRSEDRDGSSSGFRRDQSQHLAHTGRSDVSLELSKTALLAWKNTQV